jgi:hypothetical protein
LAEIWADVLARQRIGLGDDFFELGGDSLAATRMFARINQSFGTNLTLRKCLTIGRSRSLRPSLRRVHAPNFVARLFHGWRGDKS